MMQNDQYQHMFQVRRQESSHILPTYQHSGIPLISLQQTGDKGRKT